MEWQKKKKKKKTEEEDRNIETNRKKKKTPIKTTTVLCHVCYAFWSENVFSFNKEYWFTHIYPMLLDNNVSFWLDFTFCLDLTTRIDLYTIS